jgi:hypothetical protein
VTAAGRRRRRRLRLSRAHPPRLTAKGASQASGPGKPDPQAAASGAVPEALHFVMKNGLPTTP